jgi:hypothetical protein
MVYCITLKVNKEWPVKKNKHYRSLEETFALIAEMASKGQVTVDRVFKILSVKKEYLILFLVSLICLLSSFIHYVEIPFGILVVALAVRLFWGASFWLPESILQKKVARKFVRRAARFGIWIEKGMKKIIKPRMPLLCHGKASRIVNATIIALMGTLLVVSGFMGSGSLFTSMSLLLISLGLLEDDGFVIAMGYVEAVFAIFMLLIK